MNYFSTPPYTDHRCYFGIREALPKVDGDLVILWANVKSMRAGPLAPLVQNMDVTNN